MTGGEKCGGKTQRGTPCQRPAGWGTSHAGAGSCKLHTGSTPNGELHGQVELARREMLVMGCPVSMDPHEAIVECIAIVAGEVRYASARIAELEEQEAAGAVETAAEISGEHGHSEVRWGPPALNIWIVTRHQALDRLVGYSAAAIKAGVEQRRVEIAEAQGQLLADAVRGILADLGVADRADAPAVVRRHLSLVRSVAA